MNIEPINDRVHLLPFLATRTLCGIQYYGRGDPRHYKVTRFVSRATCNSCLYSPDLEWEVEHGYLLSAMKE